MSVAVVVQPGFLTTVQDLGRTGFRQFGVSPGGALDSQAARVANLLVGNSDSAAVLEVTLGALRLSFWNERLVAWCGGAFDVRVAGRPVPAGRASMVAPREELTFGRAELGCRAWLAVAGGIDVPHVLGSRSTDLRAGFGGMEGRALRAGELLPLGLPSAAASALIHSLRASRLATWGAPSRWAAPAMREPCLRVVRGADWARFAAPAALFDEPFTVTSDSDRMGTRLEGPSFPRVDGNGDLISEAVVPGTIQVPGKPILLLADCQTIGGYPKLAHVIRVDLPVAAQLRPGDRVFFRETGMSEAHRLLLTRERDLERFRIGVALRIPKGDS
ncbi:MAG: antagonist of KipI [Chthoniobacter sp.]|nr:antagonist of KipI [Chthoniobacter sp.]